MKTVSFCYRKIIDASSSANWDKMVFEDSYLEFKMQAQYFNQEKKYSTFAELIRNFQGAEKLHFLVSAAIPGYLAQLNNQIPDIVNNLGRHFLKFRTFRFEIINSSLNDQSAHQIAINFFSEQLLWHDTIGEYMLLSEEEPVAGTFETHLLQLVPYLSIHSIHV